MVTPDGERLDGTGRRAAARTRSEAATRSSPGLVVALDGGAGWPDALRAALGAGAANAEQPGAGRLDRSRAAELAEQAGVQPA